MACESLLRGDTDVAITSGVNLVLAARNPICVFNKDSIILSPDFRCKTFDARANGFVRAEGCAALVLKRYEDAVRDGDYIHGIIRGSAINNDGAGMSFGKPNPAAQQLVFRAALRKADVRPRDVSYMECHGTGTAVGDPIEVKSISEVYSDGRTSPLLIGSVKSNIGHTEACAGLAGLFKVLLCIKNKAIPPNLNLDTLNPKINLNEIPAVVPLILTPWNSDCRIAAVSSYSMSGTNVHLILQEPPTIPRIGNKTSQDPPSQAILISAKTETALDTLCEIYHDFIEKNPGISLADLAYATNTGRSQFQHRIAIIAKSHKEVLTNLQSRKYLRGKVELQRNKIGFLFTGQGSQYFGMAESLYQSNSVFQQALDRCNILFKKSGKSLNDVLWEDAKLIEQTLFAQPALFCIQYALFKLWRSLGIEPQCVLGHSVGEYAAAVAAGILSLSDAMKLVTTRSRLVSNLPAGSMLAVKASHIKVASIISTFAKNQDITWLDIAAVNSSEEIVVSGNPSSIETFAMLCTNQGLQTQSINTSHAFHSRAMDTILTEFGEAAQVVTINKPTYNYISGTLAKLMAQTDFGPGYWQKHLRDPVRFSDAVKVFWQECKTLIEIGPQPVLIGLALSSIPDSDQGSFLPSLRRNQEDSATILNAISTLHISGDTIDWKAWFGTRQKNVFLPNYPFQQDKYWCADPDDEGELNDKLINLLLGRPMPAPVSEHIFSSCINAKNLPYLLDHVVADKVVIPAAAYMECFLSAGRYILQGHGLQIPLTVTNFLVRAALELIGNCHTQTVVRPEHTETELKYNMGFYSRFISGESTTWKLHAEGTFVVGGINSKSLNIEELMSILRQTSCIDSAYETIAKVGIHIGTTFRSIANFWKSDAQILSETTLPEGSEDYICHPILLDAMIQTIAFHPILGESDQEHGLRLPVGIRRFTWLSKPLTKRLFIYAATNNPEDTNVHLYSESGEELAVMEGVQLMPTTIAAFLRIVTTEAQHLPGLMEEVWRPSLGVTANRIDTNELITPSNASANVALAKCRALEMYGVIQAALDATDAIFLACLLRGIQECNWEWPDVGEQFLPGHWKKLLPVQLKDTRFADCIVDVLHEEGYIQKDNDEWTVVKDLPSVSECNQTINGLLQEHDESGEVFLQFAQNWEKNYTDVLQGYLSPMQVMFPDDTKVVGAHRLYQESTYLATMDRALAAMLVDSISGLLRPGIIRILEVGAGSGVTTALMLAKMTELGVPVHYTFTDIASSFLRDAEARFGNHNMDYKLLNVEYDPLCQGFTPGEFDVIVGVNIVHATQNVKTSLQNIGKLIRKQGFLMLTELFKPNYKAHLSFGLLDGWWRFNDFRHHSPLISRENWRQCLKESGYSEVFTSDYWNGEVGCIFARHDSFMDTKMETNNKQTWLLAANENNVSKVLADKLKQHNRHSVLVEIPSDNSTVALDFPKIFKGLECTTFEGILYLWKGSKAPENPEEVQSNLCQTLLKMCQQLANYKMNFPENQPRLLVVTTGVQYIGDAIAGNPSAGTAWGLLKTFVNENSSLKVTIIDTELDFGEIPDDPQVEEVFSYFWKTEDEIFVKVRGNETHVARLNVMKKRSAALVYPNSSRFKVVNPDSGSFDDIILTTSAGNNIGEKDIEIRIMACGLNFRDLLLVLKPQGFMKVIPKNISMELGSDVSGYITKVGPGVTRFRVGDSVLGFVTESGLASHTVVPETSIIRMPDTMSFTSAATIPCVFLTAIVSLNIKAKLTNQDRILIHVATGGVGLAAIQIAKHIGAEIYATAGSQRKRAYLRSLGIKYIYHSRNTHFGDEIMRDTTGRGVTVVVNSLTGPNFKETSLRICAKAARFMEIGKMNIWTEDEVKVLRPDVEYCLIRLDEVEVPIEGQIGEQEMALNILHDALHSGTYKGLASEVFPLDLIVHAFHHFQEAKHIGKIVLSMPVSEVAHSGRLQFKHHLFNQQSTYLITGGLGGIGMEVMKWMTSSGAEYVVLAARNLPSIKTKKLIQDINATGRKVVVVQSDISKVEDCHRVLAIMRNLNMPPLRGIMHAAGVLSDGEFLSQNWEKFTAVFAPKVYGTWNLHQLTLSLDLDFFVMFSSAAAILGTPGQANHCASNRYLDSLAQYRNSLGLQATSINFGVWSDVGSASKSVVNADAICGLRAFTPRQGILSIEKIMRERREHAILSDVSDWRVLKQIVKLRNYFTEISSEKVVEMSEQEELTALIEGLSTVAAADRDDTLSRIIEITVLNVLKLPDQERIDVDQNFSELGLDSLMAMETRNKLQGILRDKPLHATALENYKTIRRLAVHLACILFPEEQENVN